MQTTSDYAIFKKHRANRPLIEKNVIDIMKSIQQLNLLHLDPILVDAEMRVLDGQHRLEACKRLGIPVHYRIDANATAEYIQKMNAYKQKWGTADFLNFYVEQGNENYIQLKNLLSKQNISLSVAFALFSKNKNNEFRSQFRAGLFEFPDALDAAERLETLKNFRIFVKYMQEKTVGKREYLSSPTICNAFINFFNIKAIDFDTFMHRLPYRIDVMRPSGRVSEYMLMFKDIFNYRNRSPITDMDLDL
jgi:hypothetical protein